MLHIVIDDERTLRPEAVNTGDEIVHRRTADEGLAFLATLWVNSQLDPVGPEMLTPGPGTITLWLDHDLGEGGDTWGIVRWLLASRQSTDGQMLPIERIVIHSRNVVAAKRIYNALWDARLFVGAMPVGSYPDYYDVVLAPADAHTFSMEDHP